MGNENSGRRPKPTALKILEGNPGKRKLRTDEPVPPAGDVVKPAGLSPGASAVWDRIAPICLGMRILTVADVDAFATLCELAATLDLARLAKQHKRFKPIVKGRIHAALKLERDTAAALRPYYEHFGLDPVGRARVHVKPAEAPSKWAGKLA